MVEDRSIREAATAGDDFTKVRQAADAGPVARAMEAPIVYFETFSGTHHTGGVFSIALCSTVPVAIGADGIGVGMVATAILKGNRDALAQLRHAIDNCLLLGTETKGEAN
jgi:hypothetical protein